MIFKNLSVNISIYPPPYQPTKLQFSLLFSLLKGSKYNTNPIGIKASSNYILLLKTIIHLSEQVIFEK